MVLYPRRGVDLWGSRYLVLPSRDDPDDPQRSTAAFVRDVAPIAPDDDEPRRTWNAEQDWRLVRNETSFPRAWLVHEARIVPPVPPGDMAALSRAMLRLILPDDRATGSQALDPRTTAVVETDDPDLLAGYLPRVPPTAAERVEVVREGPQRVELAATAERPGLLILADTFYPGWTAEVDGQPATIHRANRLMRGVTLKAGSHRVVFRYRPLSVQVGGAVSACGWLAVLVLMGRALTKAGRACRARR